ncbi:MAG TPA: hypothetical protein VGG10_16615 [Rhizomicrobium sp.]
MRHLTTSVWAILLASTAASAQTVTSTNDINTPVNHPYQVSALGSCSATVCVVKFPATAAPRTQVQHVSCLMAVKSSAAAPAAVGLIIANTNLANYLPLFSFGPSITMEGAKNFGVNSETQLFAVKGQQPQILLSAASGAVESIQCTISGYHTNAGQT